MIIPRKKYLQQLIDAKGNGMVKIVTGLQNFVAEATKYTCIRFRSVTRKTFFTEYQR